MPSPSTSDASVPLLSSALDRFLARSHFMARTRDSYAQDLGSIRSLVGAEPVSALDIYVVRDYLAAQEHPAPVLIINSRVARIRAIFQLGNRARAA